MHLCVDFETRSRCDIKKAGGWKYAADPSTEITCLAVKIDEEPAGIYVPPYWSKLIGPERLSVLHNHGAGVLTAQRVHSLIGLADIIEAHNASFERAVWYHAAHQRLGWPMLDLAKLRCSAATAAMCALPRALGDACRVLGLPVQKDQDGYKIMMRMCKPIARRKKLAAGEPIQPGQSLTKTDAKGAQWVTWEEWHEDPDDYVKLATYCMTDTDAERALSRALPTMPPDELAIWRLDQEMNATGLHVDSVGCRAFVDEIARIERGLLAEFATLTEGKVKSPKQIDAFLEYVQERFGLTMDGLTKGDVAEALAQADADDEAAS